MKKYHFTLILFINITFTINSLAQLTLVINDTAGNSQSFTKNMAYMFQPLDKTIITTGLLINKAYSLIDINGYAGQGDSILTLSDYRQIYKQLYDADISNYKLVAIDSIDATNLNYLMSDIIPISLLNIRYNEFKSYALDSNLVQYTNQQLYDVAGRNQSPYSEKRLFAVRPAIENIYTGQVNFKLDNTFFITNTNETITTIEIDFDDGQGFVNYIASNSRAVNSNIMINYSTTGLKTLTTKVTLSNGTTLISKSIVNLKSASTQSYDAAISISSTPPGFNGTRQTGTAYILYGCGNNNILRKPIIISDGFDPNNSRHYNELYTIVNTERFVEKVRADGFDVILLDYNDGGDYVQRNAFVLISLINTVNTQLTANGSTSKIVVVGPSMGGLVSRYALSYMEQNYLNHNTGLFISFDSPHLGANIPLGVQFYVNFFAPSSQGAADGLAQLNTVAAQQLLVYHHSSFPSPNPFRIGMTLDPYFSFPINCRKIAIANGSGTQNDFFSSCTQLLNYSHNVSIIGNVLKGNSWSVPYNFYGLCKIFEGKRPTTFSFGIPGFFSGIPTGYANQSISVSGTSAYDGAPGGYRDVTGQIANTNTGGYGTISTSYPNISFIPTTSALALNTADLYYSTNWIPNYPYPHSNFTPFDAIFAPNNNEEHVLISPQNLTWIMDELSPFDLYLQNQTINSNENYEARNSIIIGQNVDIFPNRQLVGNYTTISPTNAKIHAENFIEIKDGTEFIAGSEVELKIVPFACTYISKVAPNNNNTNSNNTLIKYHTNTANIVNPTLLDDSTKGQEYKIGIYPNPTTGNLNVNFFVPTAQSISISIEDVTGKQLLQQNLSVEAGYSNNLLNLQYYVNGIYILKIADGSGKIIKVEKVLVNH